MYNQIAFVVLEGCAIYSILETCTCKVKNAICIPDQYILILISLVLIILIALLKLVIMIKQLNVGYILAQICLMSQSILVGVLILYYQPRVQYIQTIWLAQYILAFKPLHANYAIFITAYYIIPEIFYQSSTPVQLVQILILILAMALWRFRNKTEQIHQHIIEKLQCEPTIILEHSFTSPAIQSRILEQLPYLTRQPFLVLNRQLRCLYNQAELHVLCKADYSNNEDQLLMYLLETEASQLSNSLQLLMMNDHSVLKHMRIRLNQSIDLQTICNCIFKGTQSELNYYLIQNLDNRKLEMEDVKLNIIKLNLQENDEQYIIIHFEELPNPEYQKSKSIISHTINLTQNSADTINSKLLSNIFSSISHEFGTQLNCILTAAGEAITDQNIPDFIKDYYLQPVFINSKLLQYILMNIRDFNSILLQQFQLRLQQFNPYEELQEVYQLIVQQLQQRNNQLIINCQQSMIIYNDAERFKQVIYQVLSNAIRFTQNGTITIDIQLNNEYLNVSIADTGIGMSSAEQLRLTELLRDNRKMIKISNNSVGCGLGLSISNAILNTMGHGRRKGITFSSQEQKGSQFYFSICDSNQLYNESVYANSQTCFVVLNNTYYMEQQPMDCISKARSQTLFHDIREATINEVNTNFIQARKQLQLERKYSFIDSPFNEMSNSPIIANSIPKLKTNQRSDVREYSISSTCCSRILIVDDEFFNIMSVQMILKKFNAISDKAFNGQQALELAEQRAHNPCPTCKNWGYTVYFLDINMPVMDGFDTVKELKQRMKDKSLSTGLCIANTGYADTDTKSKAFSAGMDFYLTKPIKVKDLEAYLREKFEL